MPLVATSWWFHDQPVHTDVIVIGAGPAGAAASSWLARSGRSVCCLEASYFPRHAIGESLLPRCNTLLEEAGLFEAVQRRGYMVKGGALFIRGDERERFSFADSLRGDGASAYHVPRDDFDQVLASAARAYGVDVRFGHRVEDVTFDAEGVTVVAHDLSMGSTLRVRGKLVIDCSGSGRVLPTLLDLERPAALPRRVACFTQIEGDVRPRHEGDIWITALAENVWSWIIPFSNGRSSIGVVCDPATWEQLDGTDTRRLMALMQRGGAAADRLRNARIVASARVVNGYSTRVDRIHGHRWALAGNASGFLDPIFSSGVTLALESAVLCAKLTHRQLRGEVVDWEREYGDVLRRARDVFSAFVESWYGDELPAILFASRRSELSKRNIASVLGGHVLRKDNPFVKQPAQSLRNLHDLIQRTAP